MKAFALLSLGAAVAYAKDSTLSLEVAFPGKDASDKNAAGNPVVFSLHAADENFKFGYNLNWEIVSADKNYTGTVAVASVTRSNSKKPSEVVNDFFYAAGGIPQVSELGAGDYDFNWEWKMMSKIQQGRVVTYNIQNEVSAGSTKFTVAGDADKKKKQPAFETNFNVGESSDDLANEDLAACVLKEGNDKSVCSRMAEESKPATEAGNGGTTSGETTSDGTTGGVTTGKDGRVYSDAVDGNAGDGPGSAGPRVSASQVGPLALLVAVGGALLL